MLVVRIFYDVFSILRVVKYKKHNHRKFKNCQNLKKAKKTQKTRSKILIKKHKLYGSEGPVLDSVEIADATPPLQEVATF